MTRTRTISTALALVATLSLAACGGGEEPATSPTDTGAAPTDGTSGDEGGEGTGTGPAEGSETGSAESTTGQSSATSDGCPATDNQVPDGAATGQSADLDGDRQADELWLSAGTDRELGVRTASGAVFSVEFSAGAPQAATALGQRLGDGSSIVLLNTGRSVSLYAVIDCELTPTMNAEGDQYTFDLGFTGYGTGVGCVDLGDGLQLVGLLADSDESGDSFDVTRTAITLSGAGANATNGDSETVATGAGPDDPAVVSAQEVSCGDATAQVTEPQ
ncbi:MAG TPA: hypothetical protein VK060_00120 [Ruania sp.]|nr:hypothetical protein [Ruania sp.]